MRATIRRSSFVFALAAMAIGASNVRVNGKLISDAVSGPPLEVASSERVDNLNADQVDGLEAADLVTHVQLDAIAVRQVRFDADGTFTVPAGVDLLEIMAIGGGGGGGGSGTFFDPPGGGGGSGFVVDTHVLVSAGDEIAIEIGAGGVGGGDGENGGGGMATSVESLDAPWHIVALGGEGGATFAGSNGGEGGSGFFGGGGGASEFGAPGGGGPGLLGAGETGSVGSGGDGASGGPGGASLFGVTEGGGGGGGGPGGGTGGTNLGGTAGGPATQPGAGGGGGAPEGVGGAGGDGSVLVRWVGPAASP